MMACAPPQMNNPLVGCGCISSSDYDSIFDHDLGKDCLPGLPEPPAPPIEVERVSSQDQCEAGTTFNPRACTCFADLVC